MTTTASLFSAIPTSHHPLQSAPPTSQTPPSTLCSKELHFSSQEGTVPNKKTLKFKPQACFTLSEPSCESGLYPCRCRSISGKNWRLSLHSVRNFPAWMCSGSTPVQQEQACLCFHAALSLPSTSLPLLFLNLSPLLQSTTPHHSSLFHTTPYKLLLYDKIIIGTN